MKYTQQGERKICWSMVRDTFGVSTTFMAPYFALIGSVMESGKTIWNSSKSSTPINTVSVYYIEIEILSDI